MGDICKTLANSLTINWPISDCMTQRRLRILGENESVKRERENQAAYACVCASGVSGAR